MKGRIGLTLVGCALMLVACSEDVSSPGDLVATLGVVAWTDAPADFRDEVEVESGDWDVEDWGNRPPLEAPAQVTAGVPFTVTATTVRPNGCWFPGEHSKESQGNVATITVHDYRADSDVCTMIIGWTSREIELRFDEPGEALIRLVGKRIAGEDFGGGEETVIEHPVVVQ
jgi:hypothetical protein